MAVTAEASITAGLASCIRCRARSLPPGMAFTLPSGSLLAADRFPHFHMPGAGMCPKNSESCAAVS